MTMDEKLSSGLVVSPERRLYELEGKLQGQLNRWSPERRVTILEGLIKDLEAMV